MHRWNHSTTSPQYILPSFTHRIWAPCNSRGVLGWNWGRFGFAALRGSQARWGLQSAQALGALRATKSPRRALAPQAPVDSRSLLTTSRPSSATFGQILLHGFVEVVVHGFLKVITCICQGRLPPDYQKEETKYCNFRSNPSVTVWHWTAPEKCKDLGGEGKEAGLQFASVLSMSNQLKNWRKS